MKSVKYAVGGNTSLLRLAWMVFGFAVIVIVAGSAVAEIEQPSGYRLELYDDPVPAALDGARTITAVEVKQLQQSASPVVIDVIPEHRRPDFLPENQIWIPVPHKGVPGALWLPDTGYGALSEVTENYFKNHLDLSTEGIHDRPIVFYCRADCWMSWNAAKRALTYGYTNVFWFVDGVDDWFFEGYEFAILTPAEGQRQADAPAE